MDKIKDSFLRVKEDILVLQDALFKITTNLDRTRQEFLDMCNVMLAINEKSEKISQDNENIDTKISKILDKLDIIEHLERSRVVENSNKTEDLLSQTKYFNFKTIRQDIKARKGKYLGISIGNEGDKTDRQTDRQTDKKEINSSYNQNKDLLKIDGNSQEKTVDSIENTAKILDSLDSIKKDMRLKFRRLTKQEMLVFSTIYQLEEEIGSASYKTISERISLTESSIRDYVRRIIAKGIPITKQKLNNKEVKILVSENLKKIATLSSIVELRSL